MPLDVTLDHVVAAVGDALDVAHVPHGPLAGGLVSNNLSVTDNQTVFCKVAPAGRPDVNLVRELATARHVDAHTGPVTRPLLPHALRCDAGTITVWHYQPGTTPTPDQVTPSVATAAATALAAVHACPPPAGLPTMTLTGEIVARRLLAHPDGPAPDARAVLNELVARYITPTLTDPAHGVLCHGDAHVGNLRVTGGRVLWCDLESARVAPREWDAAALRQSLLRIGGHPDAWEAARAALVVAGGPLDPDLLDQYEIVKMTSGVTYLLQVGAWDVAQSRLAALAPILDGGPLPARLDAQAGH